MQRLTTVPLAGVVGLLPRGLDHATALPVLAGLLSATTGPETAGLFAPATPEAAALVFSAPPGRIARFEELDPIGRDLLRAEIGRLVSELRRAAEATALSDPAGAGHLPALVAAAIEIPSFELVFAHEGRPVLAGWGLAPTGSPVGLGLLRVLDDGTPAPQPRHLPWFALGAAAAVLAVLGGAALAAAPWISGRLALPAPQCKVEKGNLDEMMGLLLEQEREQQLRQRLATAQLELGNRRASCPLPPATPAPRAQGPAPPTPTQPLQVTPPSEAAPPPSPPPAQPPAQPRPSPPSRPPPNTQACNTETRSGGRGITETRHYLGPSPGRVTMNLDTKREPDRIRVYHRGRLLAETPDFVSGGGSLNFSWNPPAGGAPEDYVVTVEVTGTPGSGSTVWNYTLGCPGGR